MIDYYDVCMCMPGLMFLWLYIILTYLYVISIQLSFCPDPFLMKGKGNPPNKTEKIKTLKTKSFSLVLLALL